MRSVSIPFAVSLLFAVSAFDADAQSAPKALVDSVGDALPAQALHRFGSARLCTQSEVGSLAMSRDGQLLAAADRDGRVYLWETATGKERLRTSADSGKRVALSPDGAWLALGEDAPFEIRNLKKDEMPRLPIGNAPKVFAFAPDSKSIAIAPMDETEIALFEIDSGKELRRFAGLSAAAASIAFSPDGKRIAAGIFAADDAEKPMVSIVVWDAFKGEKLKEISHAGKQLKGLTFLPDNKTLVGLVGTRLSAWDCTTGAIIKKPSPTIGASFALDGAGKLLATTDGPQVLDFDTGKIVHEFESTDFLRHIVLSADGKLLAASPARLETASPRIHIWDLAAGKERSFSSGHRHFVEAVAFAHDDQLIATASSVEGRARVWDARSAKLVHEFNINSLAAKKSGGPRSRRSLSDGLAFSADRPELFVGGQRWDLAQAKPIPMTADDDFLFEQTNSQRALLTPDARIAASFLNDRSILFWDPAKARTIQRIDPSDKKKRGDWSMLAFSPNGKLAATGKWFPPIKEESDEPLDNTIYLWDIATGKRIKSLRPAPTPVVRLMFSPDGETLAVFSFPFRLELWHLPTGRRLRAMNLTDTDEFPRTFALPTVAFAPHGQWLAFTHQEGEIVLMETLTGKEIQTLRGHLGFVSSLAFSADSRRLLSGGRDTTALLWGVVPEHPELPKSWPDSEKLWVDLGGATPVAYKASFALMANPQRALDVLSRRMLADGGATEKEIRALVANLASEKFTQRDVAMRRLKQIGTRALPALEDALKNAPTLETTRRIQELLKTVETSLTPETLRDMRGMQILEMIATPEARKLLAAIAAGDAGAGKTRLAQAALERLKKAARK